MNGTQQISKLYKWGKQVDSWRDENVIDYQAQMKERGIQVRYIIDQQNNVIGNIWANRWGKNNTYKWGIVGKLESKIAIMNRLNTLYQVGHFRLRGTEVFLEETKSLHSRQSYNFKNCY